MTCYFGSRVLKKVAVNTAVSSCSLNIRWWVLIGHGPARMVPLSQFCSFLENCFCHNMKTNKVKYIKVHIF